MESRSASDIYRDLARIQSHPRNPRVVYACNQAVLNKPATKDEVIEALEQAKATPAWSDPLSDPAQDVRDAMNEAKAKAGHHVEVYTPEQAKWLITQLEKHSTGEPRL